MSTEIVLPSPQTVKQILGDNISQGIQIQPVSIWHVESQPSPEIKFPSSQKPGSVSVDVVLPSPHILEQVLAVVKSPVVQVQPTSTKQSE